MQRLHVFTTYPTITTFPFDRFKSYAYRSSSTDDVADPRWTSTAFEEIDDKTRRFRRKASELQAEHDLERIDSWEELKDVY